MVQRTKLLIAISILITSLLLSIPVGQAQNQTAFDGPGSDHYYPEKHMLFLKGEGDAQFLDRNWTTITGLPPGSVSFSKTSSFTIPTIVDAPASPVQEPFRFEGNITVRMFASLETTSSACSFSNTPVGGPLGAETQFSVTLSMAGLEVISGADTESIVMSKDRTDPHIFEVSVSNVNVSMNAGDEVRLSIQVRHECAVSGTLWWGTYDSRTGVTFDGDIVEAKLNVVVDQNRMARIEFTPISPWGSTDFSSQAIELIGPIPWEEMWHGYYEEDIWVDHFEVPDGFSKGESNRTVRTWSTENPLPPGNYMLDACFTLSDQDPGESCHSWAILRFMVPEDQPPLLGSGIAAVMIFLGVIAWALTSLKGAAIPLPAYAAIFLVAISSVFTSLSLPDIDSETYRHGGAAPSFMLLSHDTSTGAVSLSELADSSDVVVVGLFTPGSPNTMRQMTDFESAEKVLAQEGLRASFVQIATGEGMKAYNLDDYATTLNGSWPLLLDDSTVGNSMPSGATDAVVIIDSAGFITSWEPGSMSPSNILEATESASFGSGKTPLGLLSMISSIALLPLLILSMPSERRYEAPEEALIPGVGAFMTLGAASLGFLFWAFPIALLSAFGLGSSWIIVEAAFSIFLAYHGISMLLRGSIIEVEFASEYVHSRLHSKYRDWRGKKRFSEDVYLGLWLAWISWIIDPSLIAQGVGSMARSGFLGAAFSPLMLFGFGIAAGTLVVIFRSASLVFGRYSRILGLLSVGVRPRAWGLALGMMGAWMLISLTAGPLSQSF